MDVEDNLDKELLVVIATYNERDSLPLLVERLRANVPAAQLLVIDDNSPDGTGDWCNAFASKCERLEVIHRGSKQGLGSATMLGFDKAVKSGFKFVATLDADLSHDPLLLPSMIALIACQTEKIDVVIGSRYVQGGKIVGWPWYRRLISKLVNLYARWMLGLPTRDNTSAYRLYRTKTLDKLDLPLVQSQGYSYLEEILMQIKSIDGKFAEIPITFTNRNTGSSKVNFTELTGSLFQILKLGFNRLLKRK